MSHFTDPDQTLILCPLTIKKAASGKNKIKEGCWEWVGTGSRRPDRSFSYLYGSIPGNAKFWVEMGRRKLFRSNQVGQLRLWVDWQPLLHGRHGVMLSLMLGGRE